MKKLTIYCIYNTFRKNYTIFINANDYYTFESTIVLKKYIPSILTLCNLSCGFMAIVIGDIYYGSLLLIAGIFFDAFDGLMARAFNVQSAMGKELDSLADMVSFGIAPAYLYTLVSPVNHWFMYLAPITFVIGAALRLAKFNVRPPQDYFEGLATPFATLFLVGIFIGVQFEKNFFINSLDSTLIYSLIPFFLMMLMISNIRMFSLKNLKGGWSQNIFPLICFLIFICLLFTDFRVAFAAIVPIYVMLSIIEKIYTYYRQE